MPEPKTPERVRITIHHAIDGLNDRWDLQLPRYHHQDAVSEGKEVPLARKCYSGIRFLSHRDPYIINDVIENFEDKAKQVKSNWVFKPRQEAGTLPNLPKSRSRLFEEALARPLQLSAQQRHELLQYLHKLLDDECELFRLSSDYARTSGPTPVGASAAAPITPAQSPERRMAGQIMAEGKGLDGVQNCQKRSRSPSGAEVWIADVKHCNVLTSS